MAVMQKSSMMQCRAVNSAQYPRAHKFTLFKNRNFVNPNGPKNYAFWDNWRCEISVFQSCQCNHALKTIQTPSHVTGYFRKRRLFSPNMATVHT